MDRSAERGSWWRCAAVWLVTTAVGAGGLGWLRPELVRAGRLLGQDGPVAFETLLVSVAAVAAAGCAVWLWLITTVTTLEAATGPAHRRMRGCPEAWRRFVLTACGVALASGLLVPAHAADPPASGRRDRGVALVQGLPLPDRPVSRRTAPPPRPTGRAGAERVVVVQPGDSLWSLAADRLAADATDAEVVTAWRRLYAANRTVVGADPDLVRPGQRLRVPPAGAAR